jgi:hypothetical protein
MKHTTHELFQIFLAFGNEGNHCGMTSLYKAGVQYYHVFLYLFQILPSNVGNGEHVPMRKPNILVLN